MGSRALAVSPLQNLALVLANGALEACVVLGQRQRLINVDLCGHAAHGVTYNERIGTEVVGPRRIDPKRPDLTGTRRQPTMGRGGSTHLEQFAHFLVALCLGNVKRRHAARFALDELLRARLHQRVGDILVRLVVVL